MPRIRVCQLITELGPGGAERVVYELATRLDAARFDVQVVALRGGQFVDWLTQAGVKVTVLGVRHKWDFPRLRKLADLLRRERVHLLHTHLFHADLAGRLAASLAAVPRLVHTIHVAEARFRPWQFAFARLFSQRCDRLVCVSKSVREWHARRSGLPRSHYVVIPNGINAPAFARDEEARRRVRSEWRANPNDVVILFLGRLDRQKGVDTLLAAMSHLSARGYPKHLVIAGEGPQRKMVETFISHGEGGGHCRWLGLRRDVRDVLSAADIFVMPSRWEGFGLAMTEAMAAGLPVVASRVPGIVDIVEDGQTGILVEPDNVVPLAEALDHLTGDAELRQRLGEAGREHIVREFTVEKMVAGYDKLYTDVAADIANRPRKRRGRPARPAQA